MIKGLQSRRDILRKILVGGAGSALATSAQFALMRAALANSSNTNNDYRALVCVFLFGGNDSWNMFVPLSGETLNQYQSARLSLSVQNAQALNLRQSIEGGIGLHPSLEPLRNFFTQGQLGVQTNVGPLRAPTTLEDYRNERVPLPSQLFSHNDQQATWMRGAEKDDTSDGWAGRMLDLLESTGGFARNLSLFGNNLWQTSDRGTMPFSLSSQGVAEVNAFRGEQQMPQLRRRIHEQLLQLPSLPLARASAQLNRQTLDNSDLLRSALTNAPDSVSSFPENNSLAAQLAQVAKLISVRETLGTQRQIFFVGLGGWDTHDEQNERHPLLLNTLATSLAAFQNELNEKGLAEHVTTFTLSDFGRTLSSNGDGTDHAWGGHQFILGGAVDGGQWFGELPRQALDNGIDIRGGRMIPHTASVQMSAALGAWMGLSTSEIRDIFPRINEFDASTNYFKA